MQIKPSLRRKVTQTTIAKHVGIIDEAAERARIIQAWSVATPSQLLRGADWYLDGHLWCKAIGRRYGVPFRTVVAITAALSPQTEWTRNQQLVIDLLESWTETGYADCSHMSGNAIGKGRRALALPSGADAFTVLRGNKVRSFASNLFDPSSSHHVTIDTHMVSLLLLGLGPIPKGQKSRSFSANSPEVGTLGKRGVYYFHAGILRSVARELGVAPHVLQATLWVVWQDTCTTIANPNHDLVF